MPTPVGVARQCLSEAAAAVLDDAVAVARRRSHAQTTSLHVVSALLALPSSTLREACTRARSTAYSPRLQFRALELCVGVALDRASVSKSAAEEPPPVSNSLMAAIKRSQANQRRHPETFHLYQQQLNLNSQNPSSISAVKVELKHFMMSILDDPIVSRVFGDAGFRTHEIKLALLDPLTKSRFSLTTTLPPPLFQCNLTDFEFSKLLPNFPFSPEDKSNENSRRIGKVLVNTTRRNPLLIGVYGSDAYRDFTECLMRGEPGVLPQDIDGLRVVSLEREISECTSEGMSENLIELKFEHVDKIIKDCKEPGVIVNCGDFKTFVDVESVDAVSCVVSKLKRLLVNHGGKVWLIGYLGGDDDYKKLLQQFPAIEMDLDLHLIPITNSSNGGKPFKSSLMKSFVPFGGFFLMPSELENPCTSAIKPLTLCNLCNEKYEQEVSDVWEGVSTDSVAGKKSVNLSSWLQIGECETSKRPHTVEVKEDATVLDARVMALQRKWSHICQRLHCSRTSREDITSPKSHNVPTWKDSIDVGSLSNGSRFGNLSPCEPSNFQKMSLPVAYTSSPVFAVTTDLTLGTHKGSAEECRRTPNSQDHNHHSGDVQNSESSRSHEVSLSQASQSCSHHLKKQMYMKEDVDQWKVLAEKVYWQMEAIQTISRTLSSCRNGNDKHHYSNNGNIWFSFLGPDKLGKRKIASSIAEIVFGRKENFLYFDLNSHDVKNLNSIVDCYDSRYLTMESGRKMLVDFLAEKLSKNPQSVVLLENVEKADFLVQSSLSQAVKTGKFPDSHGKEINLNNNVFILASTVLKARKDLLSGKVASEFPEETILEAKNLQMQVLVRSVDGNSGRNKATYVSVTRNESHPSGKRKSISNDFTFAELSKRACRSPRSFIDLNLPVNDAAAADGGGGGGGGGGDDDDDDGDDDGWLGELLEHVHENVVFKPFDFDSLSRIILKEIDVRLKRVVGATCVLEIDRQVMIQMLSAAWLTERENALEDWIERVLFSSIDEASRSGGDLILRLVPCDGVVVEAQACGVCLPAKINVK